jgi:hypothetical protein
LIKKSDNKKIMNGWDLIKLSQEKTNKIKEMLSDAGSK